MKQSSAKSNTPTVLLALSVVFVWGFSFIAIRVALDWVSPGDLVLLRFVPTLLVFGPLAVFTLRRSRLRPTLRDMAYFLFFGLFGVVVYNLALNTGQTRIPASLAALVIALNPAAIAIIAALTLKERLFLKTWLGLALGLAGIAVVVFGRGLPPEIRWNTMIGVLITLGAPVSWGFFTVGLRKMAPRFGAFGATATAMSLGTLPLLPFISRDLLETVVHPAPSLVAAVLFLAVACTLYGFTGWSMVLKRMEASRAGAFIYLVPIITAFGGRLILNEPLDLPLFAGTALVLGGVAIATR